MTSSVNPNQPIDRSQALHAADFTAKQQAPVTVGEPLVTTPDKTLKEGPNPQNPPQEAVLHTLAGLEKENLNSLSDKETIALVATLTKLGS